jgi:hypothetical protein
MKVFPENRMRIKWDVYVFCLHLENTFLYLQNILFKNEMMPCDR